MFNAPRKTTEIGGKVLKPEESVLVERVLRMGGGYVLDFSDRTIRDFFHALEIDIDEQKYKDGASAGKANRVRSCLRQTPMPKVGQLLAALLEHGLVTNFSDRDDNSPKPTEKEVEAFRLVIARFGGDAAVGAPKVSPPVQGWGVWVPPAPPPPTSYTPPHIPPAPAITVLSGSATITAPGRRFRVAFSFAGEVRRFVHPTAVLLARQFTQERVLYDKFHKAEFARPDLSIYLPDLYHKEADLVVVVACPMYDEKQWTGLEWRAIHSLIQQRRHGEVMLCRFERATVAGLFGGEGWIELDGRSPEEAVQLILERLAVNERRPRDTYTAGFTTPTPTPAVTFTPPPPIAFTPPPKVTTRTAVPRLAMPRHGIHPPPFLSSVWWAHVDGGEDLLVRAHGYATGDTFLGTFKAGSIRPTMGGFHWRAFLPPADHELGSNVVADLNYAKGRILDVVEDHVPGFKAFLAATGTPGT